ncbi:MAG: hypothetical protein CSA86_02960 [Arcobacter sp.]|nr:MAG: hypothetical protein CSA86_02960 [Arcobacter sp.]
MVKKQEKKSNILKIVVLLVIISAAGYFYTTQNPKEKYKVKAAGGESGYKTSFINLTGKDAEDKKIGLSDDYWLGGKFK